MKVEEISDSICTGSEAAKPKAAPGIEVRKSAVNRYCFNRDTSFNNFEDEYDLRTCFVLTEDVNPVLGDPL